MEAHPSSSRRERQAPWGRTVVCAEGLHRRHVVATTGEDRRQATAGVSSRDAAGLPGLARLSSTEPRHHRRPIFQDGGTLALIQARGNGVKPPSSPSPRGRRRKKWATPSHARIVRLGGRAVEAPWVVKTAAYYMFIRQCTASDYAWAGAQQGARRAPCQERPPIEATGAFAARGTTRHPDAENVE